MTRILALFLATAALATAAAAEVSLGGKVHFDTPVADDVAAAGGRVSVDAPVAGNARLAGGHVEIGRDARIDGNASLAGGKVIVNGPITGRLKAGGGRVVIDSAIDGDVTVAAGKLELGPNARLGGKLRFRGETLEQDPQAKVANGIEHIYRHRHGDRWDFETHGWGSWLWTAGLMLLAGVFAALLPGYSGRMTEELRTHPLMSLLFGFIALVCIPVAAILVMVTVIGIPLGLLAMLGYAALLLVGYVSLAVVIGVMLLRNVKGEAAQNAGWRALAAIGAMLLIGLIGRIPVLGHFVVFVALVAGVGLVVATVLHRRAQAPAAPAAA